MNKWISVKDKLPDNCHEVIVCLEDEAGYRFADISFYNPDLRIWNNEYSCYTVTHWMPMPELPKIEEKSEDAE